jgi:hypothetical protein
MVWPFCCGGVQGVKGRVQKKLEKLRVYIYAQTYTSVKVIICSRCVKFPFPSDWLLLCLGELD